jgi:hypothetical protein
MNIQGAIIVKSKTRFVGRYEVYTYGMRGVHIKQWIRDTFGEADDMVYANSSMDGFSNISNFESLITDEQLSLLLLKWS